MVSQVLQHKGFETFLPLYTRRHQYNRRVREFEIPLFPGYLFCRSALNARLPILTTPGVVTEPYANKIAFFFGRPLQVVKVVFEWFASGKHVDISDETSFPQHFQALEAVPGLKSVAEEHFKPASREETALAMELVLEGLTQHLKIAREDLDSKVSYKEMLKFNLVRQRTPAT